MRWETDEQAQLVTVGVGVAQTLVALFICACSSSAPKGGQPDGVAGDAEVRSDAVDVRIPETKGEDEVFDWGGEGSESTPGDTAFECVPGQGGFSCPCILNGDCLSGWCVLHLGEKVCTQNCIEDCPAGWSCELVAGVGVDAVYICLSNFPSLCLPCQASLECEGGKCVQHGGQEGAFCGANCEGEGDGCPAGYDCQAASTVEGESLSQCMLAKGECACTALAVAEGMQTACVRSSEWGTCPGWRTCGAAGLSECSASVPSQEVCDGVDNDCDGSTDKDPQTGSAKDLCDDGEPCTEDACAGQAACTHGPADGPACDDKDACTGPDVCVAGKCTGAMLACDDGNPCTDDSCDPATGCVFDVNSQPCEDDPNPCTLDVCSLGECTHPSVDDGTQCNDGDACTLTDQCLAGKCTGTDILPECIPCGDGVCKYTENWQNCPIDCGWCGDTVCGKTESGESCPGDCLPACGNGKCEGGEDASWCVVDCGGCGDGFCGLNENNGICKDDCPPDCGDGFCAGAETPQTCLPDCPPPCGDGICALGESTATCPVDCSVCGDGVCGKDESEDSCPQDCKAACGNGKCEGGEDSKACPEDCGGCGDGVCGMKETQQDCPSDCIILGCGNGKCDAAQGEDKKTCPVDCLSDWDGDGKLNVADNCLSVHNPDQLDSDGDGTGDACDPDDDGDGEKDASDCAPLDVTMSHFGTEVCDGKDNDCDGAVDDSAACPPGMTCQVGACAALCGDGQCHPSEGCALCPGDCGACCPNGACDNGETQCDCPSDCGDPCAGMQCGPSPCEGTCGPCPAKHICSGVQCKPCPGQILQDHCYGVGKGPGGVEMNLTWIATKTGCQSFGGPGGGGHMATVGSPAELSFLTGLCGGHPCWIGLNDQGQEGNWVYESGEPAAWIPWCAFEPNNWGFNEDCASITTGGCLNDAACYETMWGVCEFE